MQSLSVKKFFRQLELEPIIASNASITVGDMVWDVAGITPPKFNKPGCPSNIFNALELVGEITTAERESFQSQASDLPWIEAGLPNLSVHLDAEHAGDFQYPLIAKVTSQIDVKKLSSFTFSDLRMRKMPNDMRLTLDRHLEQVKQKKWQEYDLKMRRADVLTQTWIGNVQVSIDTSVATDIDVGLLTKIGFNVESKNSVHRVMSYTMSNVTVPFAMRTELVRRFAA
jgi:hypothetical protein